MNQEPAQSASPADVAAPINDEPQPRWPELTKREVEVAELLAIGVPNAKIAKRLDISMKTVDTHRGHVLEKLRLTGNVALAREAIRRGVSLDITKHEKFE